MLKKIAAAALFATVLSGCATTASLRAPQANLVAETKTTATLVDLPRPAVPVDVAVYEFPDLTGQAKPNPQFAEYSRAVTQGGAAILVDVLTTAGGGSWFRVVERAGLKNLVQERTLIENTTRAYTGSSGKLPPVRFAGIILEGGIVGYDSDFITGGAGAKFFGIGADKQYRSDLVTVNLRAVSVESGEVLVSVTTSKQVYSYQNRASAYGYTSPQRLLEIEFGQSQNDPAQLAVREAIELGVYSLVINGLKSGIWHLRDRSLEAGLVGSFAQHYDSPEARQIDIASR